MKPRLEVLAEMGLAPVWRLRRQEEQKEGQPGKESSEQRAQTEAPTSSWIELKSAVSGCTACGLHASRTQTVFGVGDEHADWMIIGEAPGAEEDRQGKPFVGPAGKLLDRMLASIGLDRGSVLISNTIYWRPPGNRNPAPDEVAACLPFVERLIEIVDPAVLVLVGGIASKTLLATGDGIMKLHGRWFTFETPRMSRPVPTMPIYHPAFLLRSPGQKRATWRDLLELRRRLDETA